MSILSIFLLIVGIVLGPVSFVLTAINVIKHQQAGFDVAPCSGKRFLMWAVGILLIILAFQGW